MRLLTVLTMVSITLIHLSASASADCIVEIQPLWQLLQTDDTTNKQFGGQWVLVGSISFKKRANQHVYLDQLKLNWTGHHLDHLSASLYAAPTNKKFLPLEEHIICDGIWHKRTQSIILPFKKHIALTINQTFYLVLTIPDNIKKILTAGSFHLDSSCLPASLHYAFNQNHLSLLTNKK